MSQQLLNTNLQPAETIKPHEQVPKHLNLDIGKDARKLLQRSIQLILLALLILRLTNRDLDCASARRAPEGIIS
jgi:hypothetical protein